MRDGRGRSECPSVRWQAISGDQPADLSGSDFRAKFGTMTVVTYDRHRSGQAHRLRYLFLLSLRFFFFDSAFITLLFYSFSLHFTSSMARSQTRVAVAGGAVLVVTGCIYLWTQPAITWENLQQPLDALHNFRASLASTSSSGCPVQQVLEPPPVELVRMSEDGAQYRLFHAPAPNSPDWTHIQPALSLPSECLDAHVSTGAVCGDPNAPTEQFDFVWCVARAARDQIITHTTPRRTWSNGSEALHRKAYLAYEASTLPVGAKSQANQAVRLKLFRCVCHRCHRFRRSTHTFEIENTTSYAIRSALCSNTSARTYIKCTS